MDKKHIKKIKILLCVLLISLVPITVFAATHGRLPIAQTGSFTRKTVDRIDFYIENTDFKLAKSDMSDEIYSVTFTVSAQKTQADFYAVINSLKITGLKYEHIVFTPMNNDCDGLTATDMILPVKDGKPTEVIWQAEMTFRAPEEKSISPMLEIIYTSGMSEITSDMHILEIPMQITFE